MINPNKKRFLFYLNELFEANNDYVSKHIGEFKEEREQLTIVWNSHKSYDCFSSGLNREAARNYYKKVIHTDLEHNVIREHTTPDTFLDSN